MSYAPTWFLDKIPYLSLSAIRLGFDGYHPDGCAPAE